MEATHIYARVSTHTYTHTHTHAHTHTHIYIYTHTNTHTHTHTYTYTCTRVHTKMGVTLHILVSSISSEGVVYHHSDVSPHGATAPVHVTL